MAADPSSVSPADTPAVYEFVTLDGIPVAEYDGDPERMTAAADATANLLGVALAVRLKKEAPDV